MSSSTAPTPTMTLPKKVPWLFAFNTFTQQFGIFVTLQFMQSFLTDIALLTPATVAGILSVGRIVDLVVSLFAGSIVQKANFKSGPYRTWILTNGPLLTIGVFLIFLNPNIAPLPKTIVIVIGYFFRNIPQNFLISAQNNLLAKVAGANMPNRLAITSKNLIGTNASSIICSLATLPLINFFNGSVGNNRGYIIVATAYALIMTAGQIVLFISLKEYDKYDPELKNVSGSSVNIKLSTIYGSTLVNSQVWVLLIVNVFLQMGMFTMTPLTIYYFRYVLHDASLQPITLTLASIVALIGSIINPPIARKLGKKNTVTLSYGLTALSYVLMGLFGSSSVYAFIVLYLCTRYTAGIAGVVGVNLWLDAAEYGFYKTHKDTRPFVMSINAITMKIGQLISSFTYAWILIIGKYELVEKIVDGAPKMVPQANERLLSLATGIGVGIMYAAAFVVMFFFKVNEEKSRFYAEENKKTLEALRQAKAE